MARITVEDCLHRVDNIFQLVLLAGYFYSDVVSYRQLPSILVEQIAHFFEHYKDLDPGKWVKVLGWDGKDAAHKEILDGIANYEKAQKA